MALNIKSLASRVFQGKKQATTNVVFSVVLPLLDNQGTNLALEIESIKRQILRLTGGLSSTRQNGIWQDESDGKIYDEESILVTTDRKSVV